MLQEFTLNVFSWIITVTSAEIPIRIPLAIRARISSEFPAGTWAEILTDIPRISSKVLQGITLYNAVEIPPEYLTKLLRTFLQEFHQEFIQEFPWRILQEIKRYKIFHFLISYKIQFFLWNEVCMKRNIRIEMVLLWSIWRNYCKIYIQI